MYDSAVRSQQSRPAVPTAPAGDATTPLAQTLNSSPRVAAQRALANRLNVAQRAVPQDANLPKPLAETGGYVANEGAKADIYSSKKYPRGNFAFGGNTRNQVLANHRATYYDKQIESVRVITGSQENQKGVQLDHRVSWSNIETYMDQRNKPAIAAIDDDADLPAESWYSLWDARMYYNDQTNLFPVLASDNAAAGADGVKPAPDIHKDLAVAVANTHSRWMALQRDVNLLGKDPAPQFRQHVVGLLQNTSANMDATGTAIKGHLNPPQANNANAMFA